MPLVVNCFQILYIRSLNTIRLMERVYPLLLWIAFRFCIFVLWTQWSTSAVNDGLSCELLSDFVYSFFEHNWRSCFRIFQIVVNCFQILYIRSLNTIQLQQAYPLRSCELLSDFVYSFFEHNYLQFFTCHLTVVNCFQILYIRSLNTISTKAEPNLAALWIAFRFCIFVLWTQ